LAGTYSFYFRDQKHRLVRVHQETGATDEFIAGGWFRRHGPFLKNHCRRSPAWICQTPDEVRDYLVKHLVFVDDLESDLGDPTLRLRFTCTRPMLFLFPKLFCSIREFSRKDWKAIDDYRDGLARRYRDETDAKTRETIKEEALASFGASRERGVVIESRAMYFLTATGLASTLVLANAGLFTKHFVQERVAVPVLVALGIASLALICAGGRALQAAMISFDRAYPEFPDTVEKQITKELSSDEATWRWIAALLVASRRTHLISDWKRHRLDSARMFFMAAVLGVALATVGVAIAIVP